jgi:hypothetical protein
MLRLPVWSILVPPLYNRRNFFGYFSDVRDDKRIQTVRARNREIRHDQIFDGRQQLGDGNPQSVRDFVNLVDEDALGTAFDVADTGSRQA